MVSVLVFGVVLAAAVLLSELAHRSVLSTAVIFLLAGFFAGSGALGLVELSPSDPAVARLAELALFSVLFTDGMRVDARELISAWRLPSRALLLGLPLTLGLTAMLAHWVAGLPWVPALLVGAILSPTDPVFAAAIVGRAEIPARLRHLLNVESGLNDGLVLPVVLTLVAVLGGVAIGTGRLLTELAAGVVLGSRCRGRQQRSSKAVSSRSRTPTSRSTPLRLVYSSIRFRRSRTRQHLPCGLCGGHHRHDRQH